MNFLKINHEQLLWWAFKKFHKKLETGRYIFRREGNNWPQLVLYLRRIHPSPSSAGRCICERFLAEKKKIIGGVNNINYKLACSMGSAGSFALSNFRTLRLYWPPDYVIWSSLSRSEPTP